ncbi:hypothetical protein [Salinithrix halophila]|uniref:hypothetical protein n=1 Tax=Salinithrix halophila TaxID=1485204 RepID=UPI0036D2C376
MPGPDDFGRGSERWFLRGNGFQKQTLSPVYIVLSVEMRVAERESIASSSLGRSGKIAHYHWEHQAHRLTYDVRVTPSGGPLLPSVWPCEVRTGSVHLKTWIWVSFLMDEQVQVRGTVSLQARKTISEHREFSFLIQAEKLRTEVIPVGKINEDRGEVRIHARITEKRN